MKSIKEQINERKQGIKVKEVDLPNGRSVNNLHSNQPEEIEKLIESDENAYQSDENFIAHSDSHFVYSGFAGQLDVRGKLPPVDNDFRVSMHFSSPFEGHDARYMGKVDLYSTRSVEEYCREVSERFDVDSGQLLLDITRFTGNLENLREEGVLKESSLNERKSSASIAPKEKEEAMKLLRSKKLIHHIDHLLKQSGIVGEIKNRLILFIITLTYKLPQPLHAIVQGNSGSGKSHLINMIAACLPPLRIMSITRVSSKAFYHYKEDELIGKVFLIQDYDGLDSQALLAFREMQSAGTISTGITEKQKNGSMHTVSKTVEAQMSSLGATTNPEIYYDNLSRSIVVGVDESEEQTDRIIAYNNKRKAGKIDLRGEENARRQLQILVRLIKPLEVVNPFADQITLPMEAIMRRRLNNHFLAFVDMVTLIYQHQRQSDDQGRVITTLYDVQLTIDLFFDAIWLKVDELDSSTRQFFEELKRFASKQTDGKFKLPQLREHMNLGKSQVHKYMKRLLEMEYVSREGSANKGHTYWIAVRDNSEKLRERIKQDLNQQLRQIAGRKRTQTGR